MGRRAVAVSGAAAVAAGSFLLSSCSQSGTDLARAACHYVYRSISLYEASLHADAATAGRDQQIAYEDLRQALPLAAQANSVNGSWNALMTTISESARVSEVHLIVALHAQCTTADSSQGYQSPPPAAPPKTG